MYFVALSRQAMKDRKFLRGAGLEEKAKILLDMLAVNPFQKSSVIRNTINET